MGQEFGLGSVVCLLQPMVLTEVTQGSLSGGWAHLEKTGQLPSHVWCLSGVAGRPGSIGAVDRSLLKATQTWHLTGLSSLSWWLVSPERALQEAEEDAVRLLVTWPQDGESTCPAC